MPTIAVIGNNETTVYADDHHPPHFHVPTVEDDALVRLSTLQVMAGRIRAKDFRIAIEWAGAHVEVGTWDGPGLRWGIAAMAEADRPPTRMMGGKLPVRFWSSLAINCHSRSQ
ncbi:DUF4160 domain-containing protein [Aureimonas psammosilenae]|uniref:DUF4160 domain-containing protein n=1 Tax=Aureimonas psammosilenae TaxID=2495496 RepID=UPI001869E440|nr:DUF4160 domain-containing protein [Aureimonas psammosilenae]